MFSRSAVGIQIVHSFSDAAGFSRYQTGEILLRYLTRNLFGFSRRLAFSLHHWQWRRMQSPWFLLESHSSLPTGKTNTYVVVEKMRRPRHFDFLLFSDILRRILSKRVAREEPDCCWDCCKWDSCDLCKCEELNQVTLIEILQMLEFFFHCWVILLRFVQFSRIICGRFSVLHYACANLIVGGGVVDFKGVVVIRVAHKYVCCCKCFHFFEGMFMFWLPFPGTFTSKIC